MAKIKIETLLKYKQAAAAIMKSFDAMTPAEKARLHVRFSQGNDKIGRVLNVSILPVITCPGCDHTCALFCYDVRDCLRFPKNVLYARCVNTWLLIHCPERFWFEIDRKMTRRRKNKRLRFHVGGEIMSVEHFAEMVKIAERHPDFIIWTYTKKYQFVNAYIDAHGGSRAAAYPEWFTVMFSEWDGLPVDNPHGLPVFATRLKAGNKNHSPEYFDALYQCPGNCQICLETRRGCVVGESTANTEH